MVRRSPYSARSAANSAYASGIAVDEEVNELVMSSATRGEPLRNSAALGQDHPPGKQQSGFGRQELYPYASTAGASKGIHIDGAAQPVAPILEDGLVEPDQAN
jgi:hypothetical protein